jgi:hypothetical protein
LIIVADQIRPAVVEELFKATTSAEYSDEHRAELLYNATPAERQAVADLHWAHAEEAYAKGQALAYVMARLRRYWWAGKPQSGPRPFTLGDALKVAPADVVRDVLEWLYGPGSARPTVCHRAPRRDIGRPSQGQVAPGKAARSNRHAMRPGRAERRYRAVDPDNRLSPAGLGDTVGLRQTVKLGRMAQMFYDRGQQHEIHVAIHHPNEEQRA